MLVPVYKILLILFTLCLLAGPTPLLANSDQEKAQLDWKNRTFNQLKHNLDKSLVKRVLAMPDDLLRDLISADGSIGIGRASAYSTRPASNSELVMFERYMSLLPATYNRLFSEKLLTIFLVNNFAGAGLTSWVLADDGEVYYYMILNTALFDYFLDEWLTMRSNSYFNQSPEDPRIRITTDTSYKALMYALLHEGAHLLDYELTLTPTLEGLHTRTTERNMARNKFVEHAWSSQKEPYARYKLRDGHPLNAYGIFDQVPLIPGDEITGMFLQMQQTPFVSFYSSTDWAEHYADLATYHHIERYLGGKLDLQLNLGDYNIGRYAPLENRLTQPLVREMAIIYNQ